MLADRDRIFTNLYGLQDPGLEAAKKRGAWDGTNAILERGPEGIVDVMKKSFFDAIPQCTMKPL